MIQLTKRKNHDYAGDVDAFQNFKMCEALGLCSTEKGMVVRMSDKLQRISNLLDRPNAVADEKVTDTLMDLAVYAIIALLYLQSKTNGPEQEMDGGSPELDC